jgi:hypothetical protein
MGRSRGHSARIRRLLVWLGALVVVAVPATFPLAGAAFTASSSTAGNTVSSAFLAPPSGLAVSQTCATGTITLVGSTSSTGASNDKLVLSTPAGVQANDILIAQVTNRYDASAALSSNTPGGWTTIQRVATGTGANSLSSAMLWRRAVAGEPASVTFTLGSGSGTTYLAGGIVAYRGVSTTTAINAFATSSGSGPSATLPSVTTTIANSVLVFATAKREDTLQQPTTSTSLWRLSSPAGTETQSASAGYETFAGPGATGARTAAPVSGSAWTEWVAHTVALRPGLVPSATLTWTASPSSWATGYTLEHVVGGAVQWAATVTPISATSASYGPLTNGTTYDVRFTAYHGTWRSSSVPASLTTSC